MAVTGVAVDNDKWLDIWRDHAWFPIIEECDKQLQYVVPGYTIFQIKEKWGGLRYYVDYPVDIDYDSVQVRIAEMIIDNAECQVERLK